MSLGTAEPKSERFFFNEQRRTIWIVHFVCFWHFCCLKINLFGGYLQYLLRILCSSLHFCCLQNLPRLSKGPAQKTTAVITPPTKNYIALLICCIIPTKTVVLNPYPQGPKGPKPQPSEAGGITWVLLLKTMVKRNNWTNNNVFFLFEGKALLEPKPCYFLSTTKPNKTKPNNFLSPKKNNTKPPRKRPPKDLT